MSTICLMEPPTRLVLTFVLVAVTSFLPLSQGLKIDVVRDGETIKSFPDTNAAFEDRSYQVSSSPIIGQLVYAKPHNACAPVTPVGGMNDTLFAFIDEYLTCSDVDYNLMNGGYAMMVALSRYSDARLFPVTNLPQVLIVNRMFGQYLKDHAIVGVSPNASSVQLRISDDAFAKLEELFIIFGVILLAAVALSVLVFCCSICCRIVLYKWRTRALSRWRVHQLPKRKYHRDKETCETCSICLEDFKEGESIRVLPCDHVFHPLCVDEWLQKWNRTCPLCKSPIKRRARSSPDQEESHLLSDEDLQNEREEENYGAMGHSDPLVETEGEESSGSTHSRHQREAGNPLSISTVATIEVSSETPPTTERGRRQREEEAVHANLPDHEESPGAVRV